MEIVSHFEMIPAIFRRKSSTTSVASSQYTDAQRVNLRSLLDSFINEQDHFETSNKRLVVPPHETAIHIPPAECDPLKSSHCDSTPITEDERMQVQVEEFLVNLACSYQLYGCPTYVIEVNMYRVAKGLGMDVDFAVTPTYLLVSVHRKHRRYTTYYPTSSGLDMYRLQLVDELVRRIASYAESEPPKANSLSKQPILDPSELIDTLERVKNKSGPNSPSLAKPTRTEPKLLNSSDRKAAQSLSRENMLSSSNPVQAQHDLKQIILTLASYGPGFFSNKADTSSLSSAPIAEASVKCQAVVGKVDPMSVNGELIAPESAPHVLKTNRIKKKHAKIFTRIAVEDGITRLNQIRQAKPLYPVWANCLLYGCAGAACCGLFFGGGWIDVLFSLLFGTLVGVTGAVMSNNIQFSRVHEFICAFLVSLLTRVVYFHVTPVCYKAVAISSVIWLLQGVTITLSIVELMARNLISGTVHMFYAIVISALIGFGLDLGSGFYARVSGLSKEQVMSATSCSTEQAIPVEWYPLFFLLCTLSFNLLMNAHYKQLLPMTMVAALSFLTSFFLGPLLGSGASSILASFVAGSCGNVHARLTGHPSIIGVLSGLLLLVPGSVAVTGFFMLFQKDTSGGSNLAVGMIMVALSLSVGLFLSSLFVKHDATKAWFDRLNQNYRSRGVNTTKRSQLVF